MSYYQKVQRNLLPLSQEQNDLALALQEWEHSGQVQDHLAPVEVCQLCEHPRLRYHFEIVNRHTRASLQVGSSCIHKFDISVYDEQGHALLGDAKSRHLKKEISQQQREMMLEPLRELYEALSSERPRIKRCVDRFKRRKGFSPADLYYLFGLLGKHNVVHTPQIYKIVLRSKRDQVELFSMSRGKVELVWPALSHSQRQKYVQERERQEQQQRFEKTRLEKEPRDQPAPIVESAPVPAAPLRYVERSHKYTIILLDPQGAPLERLFRDDLGFCKNFVRQEIAQHPQGARAEIRVTLTHELVHEFVKS
jgi:hypothetical protein